MVQTTPAAVTGAAATRCWADLAIRRQGSAAAQHQAYNALRLLCRQVFTQARGALSETPRAQRRTSIPTVLSRQEVAWLVAALHAPSAGLAMSLDGCGVRRSETAKLRIHHGNFDTGRLAVQAGIPTRGSPHTRRHTCATPLLQAHDDIRQRQQRLGHRDGRTTMIDTQTITAARKP